MTGTVKVAGVQMDVKIGANEANRLAMAERMRTAKKAGADFAVFPECAVTGYCFESLKEGWQYGEPIHGPSSAFFQKVCAELGMFVVYGFLEQDGSRLFNALAMVGPKGVAGSYRKTHLPFLGIDRFTTPGDRPYEVFEAGEMKVGLNICYDCSFPEPARILALQGADLIVLPTNWPPGSGCTADFVPNTRALESNVYYMAINRVGEERGFEFIGKSKICDPSGCDLVAANHTNEEILYADVHLARARNKHLVRVPNKHEIDRFRDRRPDLYGPLTNPQPQAPKPHVVE